MSHHSGQLLSIIYPFISRKDQPSPSGHVEDNELYRPGASPSCRHRRHRPQWKISDNSPQARPWRLFSTVWLAREESQKRYVALKIIRAEPSSDCHELNISIDSKWLRDELLVVDFGESFFYENPPADGVDTPPSSSAPESSI